MLRTCFSTVPSVTQAARDARVGPALGHQREHLALAGAEHGERIVHPAGRDELVYQRGIHYGGTADEPAQRLEELGHVGDPVLEQVTAALPAGQQVHRVLHLDMGGQHQHSDLGELGAEDPGRVQALGRMVRRHPDVHDDQVGMLLPDRRDELRGIARLGGHLEARAIEQAGHALAEQDIVVREDHPGSAAAHLDHYRPIRGVRAMVDWGVRMRVRWPHRPVPSCSAACSWC